MFVYRGYFYASVARTFLSSVRERKRREGGHSARLNCESEAGAIVLSNFNEGVTPGVLEMIPVK